MEPPLALRGEASADDANGFVLAFSPNDEDDAASDGSNGDEPIFDVEVQIVKDLQVVDIRGRNCFAPSKDMVVSEPIPVVILAIPLHPHLTSMRH